MCDIKYYVQKQLKVIGDDSEEEEKEAKEKSKESGANKAKESLTAKRFALIKAKENKEVCVLKCLC